MQGDHQGGRAHSGDHKGDRPHHPGEKADPARTFTSARLLPVQTSIDDFFGPGTITRRKSAAATNLGHSSSDVQNDSQGHGPPFAEQQVDSDSAGDPASDMNHPSPTRAGIDDNISSDGGSRYSPDKTEDLSDGSSISEDKSSGWEDESMFGESEEGDLGETSDWDERDADSLLEAFGELRTGVTGPESRDLRTDGASKPPPTDDSAGHQTRADTDIYSSGSGMKLVVVDCFEELFTDGRWELDEVREVNEAVDTGMDPRWPFIEAARAHRAVTKCARLNPGTKLYGRLFTRLASALLKAFSVRGTMEQQKAVFLIEATTSFEAALKNKTLEYYFDNLHLIPKLFHADLLVTKLIHKHIAHARWLRAPKPDNLESPATGAWQWTRSAEPLVKGSGATDRAQGHNNRSARSLAKKKPKGKRKPKRRYMIDSRGACRPIENDVSDESDSSEPDSTTQAKRKNAAETRGPVTSIEGGSWSANDTRELVKAVPVYQGKYSTMYQAIQDGRIRMEKKDRSQQILRGYLMSLKTTLLATDGVLPAGFDYIHPDGTVVRKTKGKHRNPWRKEADVDSNGKPTNTQWDPAQDPGRPEMMVARGWGPRPTGTSVGSSAKTATRSSPATTGSSPKTTSVSHTQPSSVRSSLDAGEGSSQPVQQGQQAGVQGFRRMVPSETVKPGRKGRNVKYKPWQ